MAAGTHPPNHNARSWLSAAPGEKPQGVAALSSKRALEARQLSQPFGTVLFVPKGQPLHRRNAIPFVSKRGPQSRRARVLFHRLSRTSYLVPADEGLPEDSLHKAPHGSSPDQRPPQSI